MPSFVVTLGGFLIWQGVILNTLEQRGTIIIQDRWINYTDSYGFSHLGGWIVAAVFTALYPLSVLYKRLAARGTQIAQVNPWAFAARTIGIGIVAFGVVEIANHARVIATTLGLPLVGRHRRVLLHPADVPREVDDLRPARLCGRRQRRGGAPRGHQRPADPRARLHDLRARLPGSAASSSPRR